MTDYKDKIAEAIENVQYLTLETINKNIQDLLRAKELYYTALEVSNKSEIIESLRTIDLVIEEPSSFLSPLKMKVFVWEEEFLNALLVWRVNKEKEIEQDLDIE